MGNRWNGGVAGVVAAQHTVCMRDCWRHLIVAGNAGRSMARSGQDCRSGAEPNADEGIDSADAGVD
jgi:hypothetical protein